MLGVGYWEIGIAAGGLGPIPNPQSPIPNPQSPFHIFEYIKIFRKNLINYNYRIYINGSENTSIRHD